MKSLYRLDRSLTAYRSVISHMPSPAGLLLLSLLMTLGFAPTVRSGESCDPVRFAQESLYFFEQKEFAIFFERWNVRSADEERVTGLIEYLSKKFRSPEIETDILSIKGGRFGGSQALLAAWADDDYVFFQVNMHCRSGSIRVIDFVVQNSLQKIENPL